MDGYDFVVIGMGNDIRFYNCKSMRFRDKDTLTVYTNNYGMIIRNNKDRQTFQRLFIDQSPSNKYSAPPAPKPKPDFVWW